MKHFIELSYFKSNLWGVIITENDIEKCLCDLDRVVDIVMVIMASSVDRLV